MKFYKFLLLCISIMGMLSAKGEIKLTGNEQIGFFISTPKLNFRFAPASAGMGITSIRNRANIEFIKPTPKAHLWSIKLTANRKDKNAFVSVFNYSKCREYKLERKGGKIYLKWLGVQVKEEKNALDVIAEICMDKSSGMPSFRIKIKNHSSKYGIWHLNYPELTLGQISTSPTNDYLLLSAAEGRAIKNPIYWDKEQRIAKDAFMLTTDSMVKISNNQTSAGYGFGSQEPYGLPYPSTRGQLQLCAYYQKDGNYYYPSEKKGPGLYIAAHDNQANPKVFYATPRPEKKFLDLAIGQFPSDSAIPGLDFEQKWPMIIGAFQGDWFDAATIYRETFAQQAPWMKKGPLAKRTDIPEWLRKTTVWIRLDNSRGRAINSAVKRVMQYREYLSGHLAIQWYAWDDGLKPNYRGCGSFPPIATAPKGFKEIVEKFKQNKIEVTPYITARLWNHGDPTQIDRKPLSKAMPWVIKDTDGKLSLRGKYGHRMCVHSTFWQNYIADVSKRIIENYQVGGIYLDEGAAMSFAGGCYSRQGCFDTDHKHPLGVTLALSKAEHRRMQMVLDKCDSVQAKTVLTGEGSAENFLDVVVSKLIHYEIWPGYVPLYSAVYHDYATAYGRTIKLKSAKTGDPIPQMTMGWQLVIGNQLGRLWPENFTKNKELRKNFKYLMKISAVKAAYPEFLNLGRMLRPPQVSGFSTLTTGEFSRINHICSLPAVVAGAWQSHSGNVGIVLTNMDDKKQEISIKIDPSVYGISGKYSLEQTFPTGKTLAVSNGAHVKLNMSLPSREVIFIQISPNAEKIQAINYAPKKTLPPLPRKSSINNKFPGIPNIVTDLKFTEGLAGWKTNNPQAFVLKKNNNSKYLEFKDSTTHKYIYMCGSIPNLKLQKGMVFKFGAKACITNPSGTIKLAIRMVNAKHRTITYRRITVSPDKKGWNSYSRSFRLDHDVKYLQFYIMARKVDSKTIAKFKDLSFRMIR